MTTFAGGSSDIHMLSATLFRTTILDVTHQSVPYDLGNPGYHCTSATVDDTKRDVDIHEHVLELAWDSIYDKLFVLAFILA